MRATKTKTQRVTLRIVKASDGSFIIQKHQSGSFWTTYPFLYGKESEALHDFNLIMKSLLIRGFEVVKEDEEVKDD